jgi:hypothetical protein
MSEPKTGGPAFPVHRPEVPEGTTYAKSMVVCDGMTLRDYFAGICLPRAMGMTERWAAKAAYKMADAMLEAREE